MRTTRTIFLLACICTYALGCKQPESNTIELPLTYVNGYGYLGAALGGASVYEERENDPWEKVHLQPVGIPAEWTDIKIGDIETNIYQTVYQGYHSGNITEEWYQNLLKSWDWPDTLSLSKEPIKTKIAYAYGKDKTGAAKIIVDTNNNLDFSDDKAFSPLESNSAKKLNRDSLAREYTVIVSYERIFNNKVIREQMPLYIVYASSYDAYFYNYAQYATAKLGNYSIAICSDRFMEPTYKDVAITLLNDTLKTGDRISEENMIAQNEYITIDDKIYKNKGVDKDRAVLMLEKINTSKDEIYSSQLGYKAILFKGQEFTTKDTLSLAKYKGKYVLLDFWATWCGWCLTEFPSLKSIYDSADKSKLEIVGIVCDDDFDRLQKHIDKYELSWPQVISDDVNNIQKMYGVDGFPTTFLIDPQGVIIAKDLRGKALENRLKELLETKE